MTGPANVPDQPAGDPFTPLLRRHPCLVVVGQQLRDLGERHHVRRLADQGVTDLIVGFRWPYATGPDTEPLETKLTHLRRYADTIIAKV